MLRLGALGTARGDVRTPVAAPALCASADRLDPYGAAVDAFCAALLVDAPRRAWAFVDRLIESGVDVATIYDPLIPRAAAQLGEMWRDDRIAFADVTFAMARLTEVFRRLSPRFLCDGPAVGAAARRRCALFALVPGETHALGVVMAADYFRRAGWSVQVELRADAAGLEALVRAQPFDLVGLSAGSRRMIPELLRTLSRLRGLALPSARFALGGPLVRLEPEIAGDVGADIAHAVAAAAVDDLDRAV